MCDFNIPPLGRAPFPWMGSYPPPSNRELHWFINQSLEEVVSWCAWCACVLLFFDTLRGALFSFFLDNVILIHDVPDLYSKVLGSDIT